MNLTPEQARAIAHKKGHLQMIACAGSGKTEVVARRVANLLRPGEDACLPRNIVAFTFTEKAAAELKDRIVARCRADLGEVNGLAEMYVGTIHGFTLELLKSEVPKFLRFDILNAVQQGLFIDRHSRSSGLTTCTDLAGLPLKRFRDTASYSLGLSILREADLVDEALVGCSLVEGLEKFRMLLRERSYLDYSAILEEAVAVLASDPDVRGRIADRVKHVIVDEYQDVNPIQERIVQVLCDLGANICVVGDDDQTIYQWRGSDVEEILSFKDRYPNATQIKLEENFRSSSGIVETARDFIQKNDRRLAKAMKPTGAQEDEPADVTALPFDSADDEARHIAETIKALRGVAIKDSGSERGISWSDMAILLRSVARNAEPITKALDAAGIKYVVAGMNNLFGTPEAEAARQLFYFMAGQIDETALLAAWSAVDTGSTDTELKRAIAGAAAAKGSLEAGTERFAYYSIQRQFLNFLETAEIREDRVPGKDGRGEILFYNLGKFSQLISDFETIHYKSKPKEKYEAFAGFLLHRAEDAYPEGWQDNQYANPDAVRIMTIHQAKGMQWPVVFVPALLKNRFPAKKPGGRTVWHLLPRSAVEGQERFEGTIEDERRLFYVAMTRAQKFLHLSWAPVPGNQLFQKKSEFFEDILASKWVKRRRPDYSKRKRLPPTPRASVENVVLSFSDLKYFFECPYQFKLRILYGFNAPLHEALGYGKSLHDVLAEVHARALRGDIASETEAAELVKRHLHAPYAYQALHDQLEASAQKVIAAYIRDNSKDFPNIEFSEKAVEISLGDGVSVIGRIDLVRRKDTNQTTIVDLKSSERAQAEDVTETQLHIYARGYEELTGRRADFVEIYELDHGKKKTRSVGDEFMAEVEDNIRHAADALRESSMPKKPSAKTCGNCDYRGMCSEGLKQAAADKTAAKT
jgi:DNA helicase-2/ATP-dependent DNA helicase PcrA